MLFNGQENAVLYLRIVSSADCSATDKHSGSFNPESRAPSDAFNLRYAPLPPMSARPALLGYSESPAGTGPTKSVDIHHNHKLGVLQMLSL